VGLIQVGLDLENGYENIGYRLYGNGLTLAWV